MRFLSLIVLAACASRPTVDDDTDETDHTDSPAETDSVADTADTADTGAPDDTDPEPAGTPPCAAGEQFVTWTRDDGATLAPVTLGPITNTYTWGLGLFADDPDVIWAEHGQQLYRSADAGCTFEARGALPAALWRFTTGVGGRLWGWQEGGPRVLRVDGTAHATVDAPGDVLALGVDPADPDHVRVGTADGRLYDRVGTGRWTELGDTTSDGLAFAWAFDPADPDRAVVGRVGEGVAFTHDAGTTWETATGLGKGVNVFALAWSPADPEVVWAEGLDVTEADAGGVGRHVWRSADGGRSFAAVVDDGEGDVELVNGNPLAPHPEDPDVLWLSWGAMGAGSWLYRYDHATGDVTSAHTDTWHELRAIAPSPSDPELVYLSVALERHP